MKEISIYSSSIQSPGMGFLDDLNAFAASRPVRIYHDLEALLTRLGRPRDRLALLIIVIHSDKELFELLLHRDQFFDLPVVLVLHKNGGDTVSFAHKLRPRFIDYHDCGSPGVLPVVKQILRKSCRDSGY